ncbi:TRAP transporter small permease [Bacillus sp. B15-48]|uniref:TRAP transporter small permease n=1 Tax=Bacillus sp. B15-48 TaxID=1548601 RepID=UPI00193F85D8|nr:TRAP transporter small permease [Bacillus sp. B15-48]MBM4764838.1 TRAP transporter small permease subunit [Bacillus sp. B15-48]
MLFIHYLNKMSSSINSIFRKTAGLLVVIIAILIFQDAILRYFFNNPSSWVLDISRYLLVYIVFLSLAPALEGGHHVSVDIFKEKGPIWMRKFLETIVFLLTTIFGMILFWKTLGTTIEVIQDNRLFPLQTSIPMKYVYFIAPIGSLQFILTAVCIYIKTLTVQNPIYNDAIGNENVRELD